MSQPSRFDTDALRALVSTLEQLIGEASRTVDELNAAIASAEMFMSDRPVGTAPGAPTAMAEPLRTPPGRCAAPAPSTTPWSRKRTPIPVARRVGGPMTTVLDTVERPPMPTVTAIRTAPPPQPADEPASGHTQTNDTGAPLRIAQKMATTHRLQTVGFEREGIDVSTVREIASAIDSLLTKYPIPLRGIEIGERRDGPRTALQPTGPPGGPRSQHDTALWIVLDQAALTRPPGANSPRWRWFRRGFERAVYTVVVREYARALDRAGGFRAREQAWQTVLAHSLHGGKSTYNLLDPGAALVDGFTEVILRGRRAGKTAKLLHDALADAASGPPPDPDLRARPGPRAARTSLRVISADPGPSRRWSS